MGTKLPSPRMLLALALVVIAVTVVAAHTVANGPYYALPSWSQKLPSNTRFIVLANWNNEAVLDRETGLVWEREPRTETMLWGSAIVDCTKRTIGGRNGWRLASVHELASLQDPTKTSPALPDGHPFVDVDHPTDVYWSATSNAPIEQLEQLANAWWVSFSVPAIHAAEKKGLARAWCVRGPANADAY